MSRSLFARLHRRFGPRVSNAERADRLERHLQSRAGQLPGPGFGARPRTAPGPGRPRAIVVGGGFGGMMAAATLCEHFEVTVLEARDRVGGRVWTLAGQDNRLIEGGAELIGYNHGLWILLAREFGLGLSVLTDDYAAAAMGLALPMMLEGRVLPRHELENVYTEMAAAFLAMGHEAVRAVPDAWRPWLAPHARELDDRPLQAWITDQSSSALTKAVMEVQFANNNGLPSRDQSYLANLSLVAGGAMADQPDAFFTESETVRCETGNQSLAVMLAARTEWHGGHVLLNSPVERIRSDGSTVTATTRGGGQVQGEALVLATPPTIWPEVQPDPLPRDMQMGVGIVCKYLSDVDARFWLAARLSPSSASDRYGMTWEGTDNQIGRQPEFSLFAGGPSAEAALARWRESEEALHHHFDTALGEVYGGYRVNRRPWPRFMAWPDEDWTRTGYSCPRPGQVCSVAPRLAEPWERNIHFAGEHACPAFFGYMEGALESGWRTALNILAQHGAPHP